MPVIAVRLPSQKELNRLFRYERSTEKLFWKVKPCRRDPPGIEAGWDDGKGYLMVSLNYQKYFVHRIIWKLVYGKEPKEIDHKNNKPVDNRLRNLRDATTSQNRCNQLL